MQHQCDQGHHDETRTPVMTPVGLFKTVMLGAIALTLLGCAASPYRWTQLSESNFPAKVSQIITEYGDLLDRRHRSGYGEWDVRPTNEPPVATYTCAPGETCQIVVTRLNCTNARSVSTECAVRLDMRKEVCRLTLSEKNQVLSIRCPLDVVLTREKPTPGSQATTYSSNHTAMVSPKR